MPESTQNLEVISATPEAQKEALSHITPNDLQEGMKATIQDNIKAGILDSSQLRSAARSYVKTRINEQILKKTLPPQKKSVRGFIDNFQDNATEIVDGIGGLIGMGFMGATAPFKDVFGTVTGGKNTRTTEGISTALQTTAKLITSPGYRSQTYQKLVKPIVDDYAEYASPGEKLYREPLSVILDVTTLLSLGAGGAAKVGTKASTAAKAVEVAGGDARLMTNIAKAANTTADVLDKAQVFKWSNISSATKKVMNSIPGGPAILDSWAQAADARKILNKNQTSFLAARNSILEQVDAKITALPDEEAAILPKVVEGFRQAPADASPAFYEALGMVKSLADDQARFGLTTGSLTSEIIERRKFQPLNNWLAKADTEEGKLFREHISTSANLAEDYLSLTGAELRGRIDIIKKFFPDADPVYMRHFFTDTPKKFSSFFLNTKPVRTFKPGFMKKSYGKDGYIGADTSVTKAQLKESLAMQATENLKWQRNIALVEQLKNHPLTKALKPGEKPLPGYKIFAPDGLLRFYKGSIKFEEELKKVMDKMDTHSFEDIFGDVAEGVFKDKTFLGVSKAKMYQVPEAFSREIEMNIAQVPAWTKLFYDKPLDAFRFFSLSLSPRWHLNNIVGNTLFSIISGEAFNPKAFYLFQQAKKAGLLPDELAAGLHRSELTTAGRLGSAAEIPMVRSTVMMHDAMLDTRVIGPIMRNLEKSVNWGVVKPLVKVGQASNRLGQIIDETFKGVAYVNKALIRERAGFVKRMTMTLEDSLKVLERTKLDDAAREQVINDVHSWYYHGTNLTGIERRWVRRAIPFYSWMRWATQYAYHVSTEAPVRASIIANMSKDFYMFTGQNEVPLSLKGSIPVGTDEDGTVYYLQTRGMNIFGHISNIMSGDGLIGGTLTTALQSAAPGIKTAMEMATGRDTFLDRLFTREDVHSATNGQLWRVDPETGRVEEVVGKQRPALLEQLLRNYIPQYVMLENVLTGGQQRYTAEGLNTILSDLFKDPTEREAIVKDIITKQGTQKLKFGLELYKQLGMNIKEVTAHDRVIQQKAREAATTALKNKALPILNENFKQDLRKKIMEEIAKGTPKDELKVKVKTWIVRAATDLKMLEQEQKEPQTPTP